MILTLTTTTQPATDLGYVLVKHPDKLREVDLSTGKAYVFFPEATEARCTAALLVDMDSVGLTRRGENPSLADYVSDRPYAASSFMTVALSKVFRSAMSGTCKDRPELAAKPFPLEINIAALPCRGGDVLVRRLFEPLGYTVPPTEVQVADEQFPEWGNSPYLNVTLKHEGVLVKDALLQLYVLIPVLDDDKHYFVGDDEVKKLVEHGAGWLDRHPERELITRRYLGGKGALVRDAQEQLGPVAVEEETAPSDEAEPKVEERLSLNKQRINFVVETLTHTAFNGGLKSVVDLGCGEGKLLLALFNTSQFTKLAGVDVALRPLQIAKWKIRKALRSDKPCTMTGDPNGLIQLYHGAATYRDARIEGFDAVTATELIEHLDPYRLEMFERVVFERIRPRCAVVTTPNVEYNCLFLDMKTKLRHRDHQFEWTREEFILWCETAGARYGYSRLWQGIGTADEKHGPPTQACVFIREAK